MVEKELRLAFVCYGGISLAIYMHGITKEIWRLTGASRDFRDNAPPSGGTQAVYRRVLQDIEAQANLKLRVITDIIAGARAGGINGIRSEEHTSELQSLMRISYAVFCLKKKKNAKNTRKQ